MTPCARCGSPATPRGSSANPPTPGGVFYDPPRIIGYGYFLRQMAAPSDELCTVMALQKPHSDPELLVLTAPLHDSRYGYRKHGAALNGSTR